MAGQKKYPSRFSPEENINGRIYDEPSVKADSSGDEIAKNMFISTGTKFPVKIAGRNILGLIDSGASVSAISYELFLSLKKTLDLEPVTHMSECMITSVNGSKINSWATTFVQISILDKQVTQKVEILKGITQPLILGMDFLTANEMVLNLKENTLQMGDTSVPLSKQAKFDTRVRLLCQNSIQIPARSEAIIRVYTAGPNKLEGQAGYLDPHHRLFDKYGLLGAHSLGIVKKRVVPMKLLNISSQPIKIRRGAHLATLSHVDLDKSLEDTEFLSATEEGISTEEPISVPMKLKELVENASLDKHEKAELDQLLQTYADVFAENILDLGEAKDIECDIEMNSDEVVRKRPYRVPFALRDVLDAQLDKLHKAGIIEPSKSNWSSPALLVPKPNKGHRLVVDFRAVNRLCKVEATPLPVISETLAMCGQAKASLFSTMDLNSGFFQLKLSEQSRQRLAFVTPNRLWNFRRLPMGLSCSSAIFQRVMQDTLRGLPNTLVYLDDIVCFSGNWVEHKQHLEQIFVRLRAANLKLKPSKCKLARDELPFLGHVLSKDGIRVDDNKIKAVTEYPSPQNLKQLRAFMGLANYFKRMIKGYVDLARPLNELTKKNATFRWDSEQEAAFQTLKVALTTAPVLSFPDFSKPFILHTDASDFSMGFALLQINERGQETVIAYGGKNFDKAQKNYSATERECLAVVTAIQHFKFYLYGNEFEIHTDHSALQWLFKQRANDAVLTGRLARWSLILQSYRYKIIHKPGILHGLVDSLSRRSYSETINQFSINELDLAKEQRADPEINNIIVYLETKQLPEDPIIARRIALTAEQFHLDDNGTLKHLSSLNRKSHKELVVCVVIPRQLRADVLHEIHDAGFAGHFSVERSYLRAKERFFWPGMYVDVKHYVRRCVTCDLSRVNQPPNVAPLKPLPVHKVMSAWSIDFVGPFVTTPRGNKYCITFIDQFSSWIEAFPVKDMSAKTAASVLVNEIFCRFGAFSTILSDRGSQFLSSLFKETVKILGAKSLFSSGYRPQTNGKLERQHRSLGQILSKMAGTTQTSWDLMLPAALFAMRTAVGTISTRFSAFDIVYGRQAQIPIQVALNPPKEKCKSYEEYYQQLNAKLELIHESVAQNLKSSKEVMKRQFDRTRATGEPNIEVGDLVWLYYPVVKVGQSKKLAKKWNGPYRVIAKVGAVNYKIRTLENKIVTKLVHANRLRKCYNQETPPVAPPANLSDDAEQLGLEPDDFPPRAFEPDVQVPLPNQDKRVTKANRERRIAEAGNTQAATSANDIYYIRKIIGHKTEKGQRWFKISWEGYRTPTWEPAGNILNQDLIKEYDERCKNRRKHRTTRKV